MSRQSTHSMIRRLRAAVVTVQGAAAVRAQAALAILGERPTGHGELKRHGVRRIEVPQPSSFRHAPRGFHLYYRLDDLEAYARRIASTRSNRQWTDAERRTVWRLIGHASLGAIAEQLGRSECALKNWMDRMGWTEAGVIEQRDRRLPAHQLAALLHVTPGALRKWRRLGCPAFQSASRRGEHYYDLRAVRDWLATRPLSLVMLEPAVRRRLGLAPGDLEPAQELAA